jgi:hypothetical protein
MTAQKVADDMRENATHEAARIVKDAEAKGELAARRRAPTPRWSSARFDALRLKRRDAETAIESTISALSNTLEFIQERESP